MKQEYVEPSIPFEYPESQPANDPILDAQLELLRRLAIYTLTDPKPQITLIALYHAAGVDLSLILGCPNTVTSIAKRLGISKQSFSHIVLRVRKDFTLLQHSTTKDEGRSSDKYTNNIHI